MALLAEIACQAVLADKAYDTHAIVQELERKGVEVVIPPKANGVEQRAYDENLYADPNKVERFFNLLKNNRRIATAAADRSL